MNSCNKKFNDLLLQEDVDKEANGGYRRPRRYIRDLDGESDEEQDYVMPQVLYVVRQSPCNKLTKKHLLFFY
jgi:hypothetical protein